MIRVRRPARRLDFTRRTAGLLAYVNGKVNKTCLDSVGKSSPTLCANYSAWRSPMRIPRFMAALVSTAWLLSACGSDPIEPETDSSSTLDVEVEAARSLGGISVERSTIIDIQRAMHSGRLSSVRLTQF